MPKRKTPDLESVTLRELDKLDRLEKALEDILRPPKRAKGKGPESKVDPPEAPSNEERIAAVRALTQVAARRAKLLRLDHSDRSDPDVTQDVRPAFFGQGILPKG